MRKFSLSFIGAKIQTVSLFRRQQQQMPFALSPQPPSTVAAGEELLFANSSFATHTGGAIFTSSNAAISSSVPVTSVLVSSPLQVSISLIRLIT